MRRLLFRFVFFFCLLEVAAWLLSRSLHASHPAYESTAVFSVNRWLGSPFLEENSETKNRETNDSLSLVRENVMASGARHWSIRPTRRPDESFTIPASPKDFLAALPRLYQRFFSKADQGFFRLTVIDSDPERALMLAARSLVGAEDRANEIQQAEDRRGRTGMFQKMQQAIESARLAGDDKAADGIELSLKYESAAPIDLAPALPIWEKPSVGKAVLLFENLLTHLVVFIGAAMACMFPRPPNRQTQPSLIGAIA